jgi:hypothetical protein
MSPGFAAAAAVASASFTASRVASRVSSVVTAKPLAARRVAMSFASASHALRGPLQPW